MIKMILKRTLSTMLVMALLISSFFVFDPSVFFPTAEAAVTTTEPTYDNLYFVVPEAIYLKPVYNSYQTTTKSAFQWYVNNSLSGTNVVPDNWDEDTQTGEFATGNIIFRYPGASSVRISFKWQSEPGTDYDSTGNITYGDGQARTPGSEGYQLDLTNGVGTASILWGNSPYMEAGTTGVWICWTATFTDSNDNMEKQAYAYTYMYKPYVGPVAVGIRGKNARASDHYGSYMSWISGVHGVAAERDGASYPKTSSDHGFLPFSSSGSGLELGDNLNLQFPNNFWFPNNNESPGNWVSEAGSAVPDRTVYTKFSTTSSHNNGDDYVLTYAYSPTAKLTVDTSRYTNLNQIPNLTVGLMVTDDESSDSGASYFLSNFTNHTSLFDSDFTDYWYIGRGNLSDYWGPLSSGGLIAAQGMDSMDAPEGEGVKFNSRWIRNLSMFGEVETTTFYVGSGYANRQGGDRIYDLAEMRCQVNLFDKSALRSAYYYAMNSFPVNNLALLSSTSTSWVSFIVLYRAVAKWLCKVDSGAYTTTHGYDTPTKLAAALRDKTNQIKSLTNPERQTHRAYLDHIKVYADQNGKWRLAPVDDAITTDVSGNYSKGARVDFVPKTIPGYTFAGYVRDFREDDYIDLDDLTEMQAADVTAGELTVSHATGPVSSTCYYVRNDFTITYDLDGGTLADGDENPTSYSVESDDITLKEPTKPGYIFEGWTGSNGTVPQTRVVISAGSSGNRFYTANWTAKTYTVQYDGNGSNYGIMSDGVFTYGVSKSLAANRFMRQYDIYYNYNYVDEESGEVYEETDFDGMVYEFRGWNTRPDGRGTSYINKQSVTNLTSEDSITLYAQWEAVPAVLLTPERPGYGFAGWYWDPACNDEDFVNVGGALFTTEEDVTLYAKWAERNYTVIFNGNGATGGSTPSQLLLADKSYPLNKNGYTRRYTVSLDACGGSVSPASATANYDFQYWTMDAAGNGTRYYDEAVVVNLTDEGAIELFAQWQSVQTSLNLPEPVYPGHNFVGWYLDEAWEQPVGDAFMPTENTMLYARWADAAYLITFDPKGGADVQISGVPLPNMMFYTIGSYDKLLPATYRTGYTFSGWKPTTSEGNWDKDRTYQYGTPVTGKYGDVTLEAQWIPIEYTITYDSYGGDSYPDAGNRKTYTIASTDTLGTPTRCGYDFAEWTVVDTSGNWGAAGTKYGADEPLAGKYGSVSLRASWVLATYSIAYVTYGGNMPPEYPSMYTIQSTETLPEPERSGYTFQGWKPQATSGSWQRNVTYPAHLTSLNDTYGDVTLLAQWSLATYMISFDERGGEEVANMFYTILSEETLVLPTTERRAYTFSGWKPATTSGTWNENTVYPAETMVNGMCGDVTLLAQWTADEYTITFDPNGGDDYPNIENKRTYTTESQEPLGETCRQNYTFLYWTVVGKGYYDENDNWIEDTGPNNWSEIGTTYKEGAVPTHKYGHVLLQAQWRSNPYTIIYHYDGGTVNSENPAMYTNDTPTFMLINPTKTGYTFAGWTGTDLGEPTMDVTIAQGSMGDREYFAHWTPVSFSVMYVLGGGTLPTGQTNPQTYTVETPTFRLNNPVRTGYTFTGWTGTNGSEPDLVVRIEQGSMGNRVYIAYWTPVEYTITYDLNGGTQESGAVYVTSYNIESDAVILAYHPTKIGYTFVGWTGSNGDEPQTRVVIPKGSIGNKSYTAKWIIDEENVFSITYDLNGGTLPTGKTNPQTYTVETPTFTLNNPVRTGYTFKGWTGSNGADPAREVTIARGSTGSRHYVANWTPKVYTIRYFDADGITPIAVAGNPTSYTVETNNFTLQNPSKAGIDFEGWYMYKTDADGNNETQVNTAPLNPMMILSGSTGNIRFVASWSNEIIYNISYFDYETGDMIADDELNDNVKKYTYSTLITLNPLSRSGYTFTGWIGSGIEGDTPRMSVSFINQTGDKVFYAHWTPIIYNITYDYAGGIVDAPNPTKYSIDTTSFTLVNPTRSGYTFMGWTGSCGSVPQMTVLVGGTTGDLTFIANWKSAEEQRYSIIYNLDGGTLPAGSANPTSYTAATESFVLENPVKNGYTFTGWSGTDLDGETNTFVTISTGSTGDRIYTAHWSANRYTVTLDRQGGTEGTSSVTATFNSDMPEATMPTRTGYTFEGYFQNPNGDGTMYYNADGQSMFKWNVNYPATLYAKWTPVEYSITFKTSGGAAIGVKAYTIESTDRLPSTSRSGYAFEGWKPEASAGSWSRSTSYAGGTDGFVLTGMYGSVTLVAQWSIESYTIVYDARGGSAVNSKSYYITSSFVLPTSTRTGYTFATWKAESDVGSWLTTESYNAGSSVRGQWGSVTLYAVWTPIVYSIGYDLAGGALENGASNPDEYTIETTTFTLANPTREGYAFVGWTGTDLTDASQTVTIRKGSTGNRQFTAVWESTAHTHTYSAVVTPATCTEIGFTTYTCVRCGHSYDSDFVPALGHVWTRWTTIVQPTATESGLEKRTCSRCGEAETRPIDPITATFAIDGATARPGHTVEVTVSVENNPGIIAAMLHIGYDPQVLTLVDVENSGLLGTDGFYAGNDLTAVPYTVLWTNSYTNANITDDGVLVTLTFLVAENAQEGTTPVTVTYSEDSTFNTDMSDVRFALRGGEVSISNRLPGDANCDGAVNLKDVILIQRYLAGGWNQTIDMRNADVDGSGTVTLADVILIARYLAGGWGVVLI